MKIEIGDTFEVELTNFPGNKDTYKMLDNNYKKGEGQGTILLAKLKKEVAYANHIESKVYGFGHTMVVEEQWFTANPKRKFKILN